jgi:hypothetical protein
MENLVVIAIVAAAGTWGLFHLLAKRKARACASGCSGCGSLDKPPALVRLRIRR